MITIDGSRGEGGGQIVRTALSLSLATGEPVRIWNVRAGRKRPGLLRQHLTCVNAAAEIGGATVRGDALGSRDLEFRPGPVRAGTWEYAVGSAGSACLVLQTVLPALLRADGPSRVTVSGGTHNPMAPPHDFLARSFLPLLARTGARASVELHRHGFYPAGGGSLTLSVEPAATLTPFELLERGGTKRRLATVILAHLPKHVATRELAVVSRRLGFARDETEIRVADDSPGPGNAVMIEYECDGATEIATSFGATNVRAEAVAERAVKDARRWLASGAPVGRHLADQLLLPLALAGGGAFRTMPLTRHATTNAEVISMFLPVTTDVIEEEGGTVVVNLRS